MENINRIIKKLDLENQIRLEEMPNIDLYMDQVIQLFEETFNGAKRNEDEKVLTKTMINNYAKQKLFIPIKNKKYSKEHLILISLIYQLKGGLSIGDIKSTLEGINEKILKEEMDLATFYKAYLTIADKNVEDFMHRIQRHAEDSRHELKNLVHNDSAYLEKVLMIASLVNMSNLYRRVAEKLVDEIADE